MHALSQQQHDPNRINRTNEWTKIIDIIAKQLFSIWQK